MIKIYCYTNILNNKKYIGQTKTSLEKRACGGRKYAHDNPYIKEDYDKYGWEVFRPEVLIEVSTREEANYLEEYYISKFNSLVPNGYNILFGWKQTEETRQRNSAKHRGQTLSLKTKRKISKKLKGRENTWTSNYSWFTDGTTNKYCVTCPKGYWRGRTQIWRA